MKIKLSRLLAALMPAVALIAAPNISPAQSSVVVNAFNTSDEVTVNNGQPWINWYGTAFYQVLWDSSDASNNVNSGSIRIEAYFPDSGIGGQYGPQFLAMNGYDGIQPPIPGNGNSSGVAVATNISFDLRFDPMTDPNGSTTWPTIEVGTRGQTGFTAYNFGSIGGIPVTQTNWVHVNIPIAPSANWTNIPHVFFKHYSGSRTNWVVLYLDNIAFTTADISNTPPTLTIEKAVPALRLFSGPAQYDRTQVASVDTNQSWVGGAYPVSYSVTIPKYDTSSPLNEFHAFLTPLNFIQGGGIDSFTDYSTASNNFRLLITGGGTGTTTVFAQLDYKTNTINANPNQVVLSITNSTPVGTWTLTFNSATAGTLTAPGASPVAFSLPANVAATFANPLVAFFGVQPNPTTAIGQHLDISKIQTINVAAPGVPINSDFTTGAAINTNVWRTASVSANAGNLVMVDSSKPWWVNWTYPDTGFTLGTKADLSNGAVPWKTPWYFTGYDTNNPILKRTLGSRVSALIPQAALPSVSGLSNSVPAGNAFFRLSKPGPAE